MEWIALGREREREGFLVGGILFFVNEIYSGDADDVIVFEFKLIAD